MLLSSAAIAASALAIILAPNSYAEDASWKNGRLVYEGREYIAAEDIDPAEKLGLPADSQVYLSVEDKAGNTDKAHVIFFPPKSDITQASSAQYATYDFTPPDKFSRPSARTSISVKPSTEAATAATSCDSRFTLGVGWIICPITNFLASAMDWTFGVVSNFLSVRPAQLNHDTALYRAWDIMRNIANVAFVIAFLIVIYSQLTGFGMSNYGIKRIFPRLLVAALLVNMSFFICAIAIDLSNIAGFALQDLFIAIRNNLVGESGNSWDLGFGWKTLAEFILSGGAVVGGLGAAAFWVAAETVGGAVYFLVPILLSGILSVLVALIVLAGRQAIITVMVIIAPLAFVAYLLPNTEKWFEKWRDLFSTMLIMFPAFSLIFGGAQLAGTAIIQNSNSIITVLLGMAVQVIPLAITPILVRLSGSLLGRIAGMVNNPQRGLVDRTRNWSHQMAEQQKARTMANAGTRRRDFMARGAVAIDQRRRRREGWHKVNEARMDARFANSEGSHAIGQAMAIAEQNKEIGEAEGQRRIEAARIASQELQDLDIRTRVAKMELDLSRARVEANWEEFKAGNVDHIVRPAHLAGAGLTHYIEQRRAEAERLESNVVYEARAEQRRGQSAQAIQLQHYASEMSTNQALRHLAAGIDAGGETKVEAAALSEILDAQNKTIAAGVELLRNRATLSGTTLKDLSANMVKDVSAGRSAGYSQAEIEAAFEAQARDGQIVNLENARISPNVDQTMLTRVIARNADTLKVKGGFHLQSEMSLAGATIRVLNSSRAHTLGDTAASNMKDLKYGWVVEISDKIDHIITDARSQGNEESLRKAYNNVYDALNNPQIRATIGDRREELEKIEKALYDSGFRPSPEVRRQIPNTPSGPVNPSA